MLTRFFLVLAAAAFPALTHSATIVEGVDYADAPNAMVGSFGAGDHTISGTLTGDCLGNGPISCLFGSDPQDILTFSIAPSAKLVSLEFTLSNNAAPTDALGMGFTYNSALDGFAFNNLLSGTYNVLGLSPVGGDVTLIFTGDQALSNISYSAGWSVNFEVSAIPIPGSMFLLSAGLIGLSSLRRTKQR